MMSMMSSVDTASSPDVTFVPVTIRHAPVDRESWWNPEGSLDYGAGPLVYRCMREYYWNKEYALRVLKGYKQFLELKKILEDWDAKIVSPSPPVYQMWHQHILDVTNYCHDCLLICGRVVGNDPDSPLDEWSQNKRMVATKQLLRARFEREIDPEVWRFENCPGDTPKGASSAAPSRPTHPQICLSGLTADEKKYDQMFEEKEKLQQQLHQQQHQPQRYIPHNPFSNHVLDYETRKYRATVTDFDEKKDDDTGTISSLSRKVKNDSVVIHNEQEKEIEVEEQTPFHIRVRTLKGSIYTLTVNNHTSVLEVKSMIHKEHGIPEDKQHLLFYGKVLEDRKSLDDYSIPPESGLQLLVRSRKPLDMTTF